MLPVSRVRSSSIASVLPRLRGSQRRTSSSGRVDLDLDRVRPALGHLLLERPERVQVVRRGERLVQHLHRGDPVDAVHPAGVGGVRPAEHVPAPVPHHDGPRVDLEGALAVRAERVADPDAVPVGAARTRVAVVSGCGGSGSVRRALTTRSASSGRATFSGRTRTILPTARADRVVALGAAARLQHRHRQAERLGGGEHQRRQPQPAADPVAAVRAADRLDRDAGLAQDRRRSGARRARRRPAARRAARRWCRGCPG